MSGGLFRALGELSGLDRLVEEETPPILSFTEDDVIVPPEKQAESLSMIFGFLEQQKAEAEAASEPAGAGAPAESPPAEPEEPRPEPD
jgi:hypothetical protein